MELNRDLIHKYTRRKKDHDYFSSCHYHIILRKASRCEYFGRLTGDARIPEGNPGCAHINHSKVGKIIAGNVYDWSKEFPVLKFYQYNVMPDHVHIFFWVREKTDKHLGKMVAILKANISKEVSSFFHTNIASSDIFEENFTDKIVYSGRNFDTIRRYIRENPHRLAMRFQFPDFFKRREIFEFGGEAYEAYGNHFILENPFKMVVRAHRKNTAEENEKLKEECLEHTAAGGVLVSPFIHPVEKEIKEAAERMGGKIILIQNEAFREKYKPAESNFNLCGEGRLLIVAPVKSMEKFSRETCMKMNDLAEIIVKRG